MDWINSGEKYEGFPLVTSIENFKAKIYKQFCFYQKLKDLSQGSRLFEKRKSLLNTKIDESDICIFRIN